MLRVDVPVSEHRASLLLDNQESEHVVIQR
jgi:hypothetical protein